MEVLARRLADAGDFLLPLEARLRVHRVVVDIADRRHQHDLKRAGGAGERRGDGEARWAGGGAAGWWRGEGVGEGADLGGGGAGGELLLSEGDDATHHVLLEEVVEVEGERLRRYRWGRRGVRGAGCGVWGRAVGRWRSVWRGSELGGAGLHLGHHRVVLVDERAEEDERRRHLLRRRLEQRVERRVREIVRARERPRRREHTHRLGRRGRRGCRARGAGAPAKTRVAEKTWLEHTPTARRRERAHARAQTRSLARVVRWRGGAGRAAWRAPAATTAPGKIA